MPSSIFVLETQQCTIVLTLKYLFYLTIVLPQKISAFYINAAFTGFFFECDHKQSIVTCKFENFLRSFRVIFILMLFTTLHKQSLASVQFETRLH